MVDIGGTFDSDQHEDIGAFDPIPAGDYKMAVTASSMETTKAKTGKYIKLEITIIDGEYKGRKIWNNLNIVNPNPVAVEIAQKELATICRACHKLKITDTQELHEIPFIGKIKIRPAKDDWPASNEMVNYKPMEGTMAMPTQKAPAGEQSAPAEDPPKSVPWA